MNELETPKTTEAIKADKLLWLLWLFAFALMAYIFSGAMVDMEEQWQKEEYSHGYMIPLVALYLFWKEQLNIPALVTKAHWSTLLLMVLAMFVYFVGEISTTYEFMQYAMLLCFITLCVAFFGFRACIFVWGAFVYLLFMIPLPSFVYKMLSSELQLISSYIGVMVIRWFDISVYLEGNVIDLGVYQLQVVEACSGLRYLFPLMSFGFLIAYLFKAPLWQKAFLFISTVPITVLMNSFRIGVIGVTVEYWGIEMAEGFLHDFEGWVVFMGCLGVLVIEMWLLHYFSSWGGSLWDRIDLDLPEEWVKPGDFNFSFSSQKIFIGCIVVLAVAAIGKSGLESRSEPVLERKAFSEFPLRNGSWVGRESSVSDAVLKSLKSTDEIMANYSSRKWLPPVNLWMAYYDSQRGGAGIHSPRTCIPGGGWEIEGLKEYIVPGILHSSGQPLKVNRTLIKNGDQGQLVYYWFEQRGRNITNEYLAKWYIFLDSFNQNRTDGALVRVIVPLEDVNDLAAGDRQIEAFITDFYSPIVASIPGKNNEK